MTEELVPYKPTPLELTRNQTDDWFDVFPSIIKLAEYVADTEFVPDAMRRRPAAVAAAVLTGRELGLPPMVALRHLFVVKGKVGQSAELMRALILRAGHEIEYLETTDTRCIVQGRRNHEKNWTKVQFTTEDAKRAGIDLRVYAADKLVARATSRLARRKFADVIMGLPTVDELEDYTTDATVVELTEVPAVQRRRTPRKPKAAATQPKPPPQPEPDTETVELLDDGERGDEAEHRLARAEAAAEQDATEDDIAELLDSEPAEPELPLTDEPESITGPQLKKLSILLEQNGFTDSPGARAFCSAAIGRDITSRKDLTKSEASYVIDTLENAQEQTDN